MALNEMQSGGVDFGEKSIASSGIEKEPEEISEMEKITYSN